MYNTHDYNPNPLTPIIEIPNHNPQPPIGDANTNTDNVIETLRNLIGSFRITKDPTHLSLATSLETIVSSISHDQGKTFDISK
jgi:hypothetical protein